MGDTGLEQSSLTPSKTQISIESGAKCGTLNSNNIEKDPELQEVITAWLELPGHIKSAIKTLIQTQNKS